MHIGASVQESCPGATRERLLSMRKILQHFERPIVADVEYLIRNQFERLAMSFRDMSIAVAVGSRGIANLNRIVKATVECLKSAGGRPFIVPAMGSHGGATAEGQAKLLAGYGITEEAIGCPVCSSMEVVELPNQGLPHKFFMDRFAWEADGVVLINRIKPHTDFHGPFESGLMKMSVIGLGKERQAFEMHQHGVHGLRELTPAAALHVLATGKICFGVGIVENAYDETAHVELIPADAIPAREPRLLELARENMPRLPMDDIDVLIVDELGKNISGTGMDTNIIGRIRIPGEPEPATPRIRSIMVRNLTPQTEGNATGMGLADVVTREFFEEVNFSVTRKNIITSGFLERGKLPIVADDDRQAFEIACRSAGIIHLETARILRIKDTLHLGENWVSENAATELTDRPDIEISESTTPLFCNERQMFRYDGGSG